VRRLWVRWTLLIVFVAVLATVFISLGDWQLDRLRQRKEQNATTTANASSPILPADQIFTRRITDADEWQRVEARGTFDADHQFVIRYRENGNADGYQIVTPLRMSTGTLLVDRGFVALPRGSQIPAAAPPPPSGEVVVVGHVRRNEQGRSSAITPVDGQMRLINSDAIAATLPYPVRDGYLSAMSVEPPQTGNLQPVAPPELSEGPHLSYAVQWFIFTAFAIAGIVFFVRSDLRARRDAAVRSAG
jgi:cytochrome oxidase assembly protein ShyY1